MEQSKKQKQHFVVVHGACHGAWCWYKVVMRLRSEGQHVTALDMAASGADPRPVEEVRSIADFYRPLMELMEGLAAEERVVLVGHSMGGICISAAMEKFPSKIALAVLPGVNSTPLKKAGHCSPPAITPKPSAAVGANFHANLPSNAKIMCCWSWSELSNEILFPYERFVRFFNWEKPGYPPCGLKNCGNSCFANVVLQCLTYTRPLAAFFLEEGHKVECN